MEQQWFVVGGGSHVSGSAKIKLNVECKKNVFINELGRVKSYLIGLW